MRQFASRFCRRPVEGRDCPLREPLSDSPQVVSYGLSVLHVTVPDEVHGALKDRAQAHGRSTEAKVRDIIARAVLPEGRPKAGDVLCDIWEGADISGVSFERDRTAHEPMSFE